MDKTPGIAEPPRLPFARPKPIGTLIALGEHPRFGPVAYAAYEGYLKGDTYEAWEALWTRTQPPQILSELHYRQDVAGDEFINAPAVAFFLFLLVLPFAGVVALFEIFVLKKKAPAELNPPAPLN